MIEDIRKTIKHAATYGTGVILSKIVGFIMLPIYTRYLTPSDYGVVQLLVLTADIIEMVIGLGLAHAVSRFYYQYESEKEKNEVISSAFLLTIFSSFPVIIFLILFSSWFSMIVFNDLSYTVYFKLVFFNLLLSSVCEIPLVLVRAQQKSTKFVMINLIRLIIGFSLNIYFVVILEAGVLGILYSSIITSLLISSYLSFDTFRQAHFHFSIQKAKELIKYGAPLIFSNIGAFILTFSDRYFLNYYTTLSDVGIYSLGYKFGMLMSLFLIGPFTQIWSVQMFEIAKKDNAPEIFQKIFFYFPLALMTIGLFISLFSKDAIRIMANPNFWEAYKVVPIIVLAYIIYGFYMLFQVGILVSKKTGYLGLLSVIAACSNIFFNWLLIPRFGLMGAAWATVLAYLVRFLGVYSVSQRLMPISYEWIRASKLFSLAFIVYFFSLYYNSFDTIISSLSFNIVLFLLFSIFIYKINFKQVKIGVK